MRPSSVISPALIAGVQRVGGQPAGLQRRQEEVVAAGLHRGGDQQRLAGGLGQDADLAGEGVLDLLARGHRPGQRLAAGELVGAERARHLGQREGVAGGGDDEVLGDRVGDAVARLALEQLRGGGVVQAADRLRRDALEGLQHRRPVGAHARRAQQHDALGAEPARDEDQRLARRVVQPVDVVGDHEVGLLLGGGGQQRQHPGRDGEAVERGRRLQRQRAAQRRGLDLRDLPAQVQQRRQQLQQARERDVGLGLVAARAQDPEVALDRGVQRTAQQRGLADPGLAVEEQRGALALLGAVQQLFDVRGLALTAQ